MLKVRTAVANGALRNYAAAEHAAHSTEELGLDQAGRGLENY
jgi:hypothetical protein